MDKKLRSKRGKPNKKWSDAEVNEVLNYLIKEKEFEHPTAQLFYRRFLTQSNLDAPWDLLRWKVRHLKGSYKNAEAWRKSIDAGLLESASGPSEVQARILKICPHYVKLKKIFGSQTEDDIRFDANENETSDVADYLHASRTEYISVEDFEFDGDSTDQVMSEVDDFNSSVVPVSSTSKRKRPEATTHRKTIKSNTSALPSDVDLQRERLELEKSRLKFERWKCEQDFELRREELAVKKEELQVKRLEIETNGRVAMYEIDMKYKINSIS